MISVQKHHDRVIKRGRMWEVYNSGEFRLNAFDAFGNRDYYTYFGYMGDKCIVSYPVTPEPDAIKAFKKVIKQVKAEGVK